MAKMKMKYVRIFALREQRKSVLEFLQRQGLLDMETANLDEETAKCPQGFSRPDLQKEVTGFLRSADVAEQALKIINTYSPQKKGLLASLSGRREISADEYGKTAARASTVLADCYRAGELSKQIAECEAQRVRISAQLAALEPWQALDVPLRYAGTRSTRALIGSFPAQYTLETLAAAIAGAAPDVVFDLEIVSASNDQTCAVLFCPRAQAEAFEQALRTLGFTRPQGATSKVPRQKVELLHQQQAALEAEKRSAREEICALADRRQDMELIADYYRIRAEKYQAICGIDHTAHTFYVRGYVPAAALDSLAKPLETKFGAVVEAEDADPALAPVILENGPLARPAETITDMYALPLSRDIDPTPVTGFFYYLFFGMMLSDAGYGLLLALGSWFLIKKCRPEQALRRNLQLFFYCGVSTVLWGLVFGSFFGDAVPILTQTFFGRAIYLPALLEPMNGDAVTLLILSIALGFVQIIVGLCAKFAVLWKNGERMGAFFDAGLWILLLLSVGVLSAGMLLGYSLLLKIGIWLAVAAAAGLVLTQGRQSKGPMKLISGVASLYDVTGYVSDLLSFSRLMALALTTAAMASVFNMLSTMAGGGIVGVLMLLIIFPIGHAINFGLNALGAYVHTLRLQYVELFSKFYEGGGRPFRPFAFHGKYVRIKEEQSK